MNQVILHRFALLFASGILLTTQRQLSLVSGQQISSEFVWGQRANQDVLCFMDSVNTAPLPPVRFWIPVTRLFWFMPNNAQTKVSYIRVWADAPHQSFKAQLLIGGAGTGAPTPTVLLLSRPWKLYANVVIYCE
ncbi:uncharacterized protein LOC129726694 [Wyeomyia smithii]|uniref:uncharacterized protein LOC129726694 n=1 Tax=Wyeomyia smithii TaxID=174621 RepID=UPI0024681756|nr:uncharacterized protein LOC129726694 [Wyeomyia smithii]